MKEIFKDIVGYEGSYQVSNLGRVKSLDRTIDSGKGFTRFIKGRILKSNPNGNGYHIVSLNLKGKLTAEKVHKLVAMAFLNHKPCGMEKVIDHMDNDKSNNRLDNLQIITVRENSIKDKKTSLLYVGVTKRYNKFTSRVQIKGNRVSFGTFNTQFEAYLHYRCSLKHLDKYKGNNKEFSDLIKSLV